MGRLRTERARTCVCDGGLVGQSLSPESRHAAGGPA